MSYSTLFIPDISGFTHFVKNTEINHGRHIIQELIDIIIHEGSKIFQVAEIEGDAVFFYSIDKVLTLAEIEEKARHMYHAFHQHLLLYEQKRICNCGACSTAINLKLKFITHAGEITLVDFAADKGKPYGEAVIAVHRLLKNKIGIKEYLLFSDTYLTDQAFKADGHGTYHDKELGDVSFQYKEINQWMEGIDFEAIRRESQPSEITASYASQILFTIDLVHQFISDFRYRHLWNSEADQIIFDESKINQVGAEHYCIVNGQNLSFDTIKPKVEAPNQRSYGEVLKNPAPFRYFETNFILSEVNERETGVEMRMSVSFKWVWQRLMKNIIKKKLEKKAAEILNEMARALTENVKQVA